MKRRNKIFSHLNLILFLSSFLLLIFTSFQASNYSSNATHSGVQLSQSNHGFDSNAQQLSENSEFEDDNDDNFEMASFVMPFLVSFDQFEVISAISPIIQFTIALANDSIYLAIRSIRI